MPAVELEDRLGSLPVHRQADWLTRFPHLVQGISGRSLEFEFGFAPEADGSGQAPKTNSAVDGWSHLMASNAIDRAARCRQVHGAEVAVCDRLDTPGLHVLGEADALVTRRQNLLLAVTVADCVPVFLIEPERRILGIVHAGWRGTAAGVLEAALDAMRQVGADLGRTFAHLGPAICGGCYEVGPEVTAALGTHPAPRVDLRARITESALAAGITRDRLTSSGRCTLCDSQHFFSYRGGDRNRRMCAFIGWPVG